MAKTKMTEKEIKEKKRELDIASLTPDDYYDFSKILSKNADINIIFGQRSNGKTYSVLKYCLEQSKKGNKFVYVRRWAEDITTKNMTKLMDPLPIKEIFGKTKAIKYYRSAFILYDEEDAELEDVVIGYVVALNQVAHTKSVPFVNVKNIVLDEFLQLKTERILRDEFDAWEQTLSTIIRTAQDVKVFLCGNTVSKYSPYFQRYGIDIKKLKQGEIKEISIPNDMGYTKIAAEWCKYNPKIGQKTSKYVIGSKMAKTGEWEIKSVDEIPHTDSEIATEKMLCSIFDSTMGITIGIYLRKARWTELIIDGGIYVPKEHFREFLVLRQTDKQSSFYHLTDVKDLSYGTWGELKMMLDAIKEECEIDIVKELKMGRVFAEDMFTADYFCHAWSYYNSITIKELI